VKYESVGMDFKASVEAMQRRRATLDAVGSGVAVKQDGKPNRKRVVDEVKKFLAKKSLLKDPKTAKTYTERLSYFLDWCERSGIKHLDQLTEGVGRRSWTANHLPPRPRSFSVFQTLSISLNIYPPNFDCLGGNLDFFKTHAIFRQPRLADLCKSE
jgi:hypothetical protein